MKTSNKYLYAGLGVLAIFGIVKISQKTATTQEAITDEINTILPQEQAAPIDENKLLKVGVKGIEVKKLQELLNVVVDGIFGSITEAALFKDKAVKQVTLKQFAALPSTNPNRIASGNKVMAINPSGTPIYLGEKAADGFYYDTKQVLRVIDFGKEIGTVKSSSTLGNWYLVLYANSYFVFVKAADLKKI